MDGELVVVVENEEGVFGMVDEEREVVFQW